MGFSRLYARKLVILVAAIGITVLPSFVYGLGLGAIKLNSSLSEILDAEIDLIAATENDVSDLKVKLASNDAFLRAGIERTALLNSLRFAVKRNNSGKYIIKITSRKPIREPFLNFLLEVNWKNGRMLREYTMLIDPPGRRVEQTQQSTVQSAQVSVDTNEATSNEVATEEVVELEAEVSSFKDEATPFTADEPTKAASVDNTEPASAAAADNTELAKSESVDKAYSNDPELLPHRSVADVPAPKEEKDVVVKVADEPEVIEPEPVIPDTIPEPEVILPESEIVGDDTQPFIPEGEADTSAVVDDSKAVSGEIRAEHAQSGEMMSDQEIAQNEMHATEEETFSEGELFPTIPLTEYDESKSIQYDHEPTNGDVVAGESVGEHADASSAEPMERGELDYGITQKTDNLWTIASRMKGDDASVYQVMMALLKSNPSAFTDGNVHRLKVGQVLRIEDPSLITAISKSQAAQDYTAQTEAWDAYRQQVAAAASEQPLSTGPVDFEPMDNVAEAPSGELTLSAPEGDDLATSTAPTQDGSSDEVARLRGELDSITQQVDAERGKNSALNERLRELESELEAMQRSLSVRNDEFAALQQQATTEPQAVQPTPVEPAPVEELAEPAPAPAPVEELAEPVTPQLEDEPVAVVEPEVMPTEDVVAEESAAEAPPVEQEQPVEPAVAEAEDAPSVEEPVAQVSTSLVDTIVSTVLGILKPILGSSLLIIIGLPILIIVIILIVIMMVRKRSSANDNFQESILSGVAPTDDEAAVSVSSQNSSETSSFLSDFAISGVGAIQTEDSEVDPLTEADVFMAYGRYEAAEERLQEAISADPERNELKVKLLEVYNTNKNQSAFESTAEDLYASLGDDAAENSEWQKVVVMGKQIAPNNPIFSNSPTITSETTESVLGAMEENLSNVSMTDSQVMDIGLETGVFSAEELNPDAGQVDPSEESTGLDFNLDDSAPVTSQEETQDNIGQPDELDFNLGDGGDVEPATETASLDFNLDGTDEDESTKSMAIDLNAMAGVDNTDDEPTASMVIDSDALDLDSTSAQLDTGSLDFSLDSADETDSSLDLNLDAGDAMDMSLSADADEVGTKLDLAKAYIDMGDSAGAKSILDEVLAEGNDDQRQEAEQLVSQLS